MTLFNIKFIINIVIYNEEQLTYRENYSSNRAFDTLNGSIENFFFKLFNLLK